MTFKQSRSGRELCLIFGVEFEQNFFIATAGPFFYKPIGFMPESQTIISPAFYSVNHQVCIYTLNCKRIASLQWANKSNFSLLVMCDMSLTNIR